MNLSRIVGVLSEGKMTTQEPATRCVSKQDSNTMRSAKLAGQARRGQFPMPKPDGTVALPNHRDGMPTRRLH